MKKFYFLFALAFAVFCNLNATNKKDVRSSKATIENMVPSVQNAEAIYTLTGTVYDPNSNEALSGATITINGRKYYSDLSGNFNIPKLTPGKHVLSVDFISYQSQTIEINLEKNEEVSIAIKQL